MRGSAIRLTQSFVNATTTEKNRSRYWDAVLPGLVLAVTSKGRKSYFVSYRDLERRKREPLLGNAKVMTLEQAREAARGLLAEVQLHGKDLVTERRAAIRDAEEKKTRTFQRLHDEYAADSVSRRSVRRVELETMYTCKHLLPRFGERSVADLTADDMAKAVSEIGETSGYSAANTVIEILRQMGAFAVSRHWLAGNVAVGLQKYPKQARERVATSAEVGTIWRSLRVAEGCGRSDATSTVQAIQFAILTLQRRAEAAGVHWDEIDWENRTWTIPGARAKNKKVHVVPLSAAAIAVLYAAFDDRKEGYAFRGRDDEALDPSVVTKAFARYLRDWGITGLRLHDLRRTGATMMTSERLNVMGEVVSRILNHTPPGPAVTLIYNRNSYLPQKRAALEAWAKEIERLARLDEKTAQSGNSENEQVAKSSYGEIRVSTRYAIGGV